MSFFYFNKRHLIISIVQKESEQKSFALEHCCTFKEDFFFF